MDNWNGTNYDEYYDDYDDEYYDDDWHDDYDDWNDYVQEPVPLMHRLKDWLIARWWRLRNWLGLPVPYDDIPF
jgi:hypothetical protein